MLVLALVLAAFLLVVLYNRTVNFEHGLAEVRSGLKEVQAQNVELREQIFGLFDASNFEGVLSDNLIKDKNPEYLEISTKWSFASQH